MKTYNDQIEILLPGFNPADKPEVLQLAVMVTDPNFAIMRAADDDGDVTAVSVDKIRARTIAAWLLEFADAP